MRKPDTLIIDGHAFSWQRLVEARRNQLEALEKQRLSQPTLFELKEDCRPMSQKTATQRYRAPALWEI